MVKDCVLAMLAAGTLWVGRQGLQTWRRQLVGTVHFDVARKHAKAAYQLRDAIRTARSPVYMSHEVPLQRDRSDAQAEADVMWRAFSNRMDPVWEALRELDLATLESEALWGAAMRDASIPFRGAVAALQAAHMSYCDNIRSSGQTFGDDAVYAKQIRGQIYGLYNDSDELGQQITDAVADLVAKLQPHLER